MSNRSYIKPVKHKVRRKKNQLSTGEKVAKETIKIGVGIFGALIKGLIKASK